MDLMWIDVGRERHRGNAVGVVESRAMEKDKWQSRYEANVPSSARVLLPCLHGAGLCDAQMFSPCYSITVQLAAARSLFVL